MGDVAWKRSGDIVRSNGETVNEGDLISRLSNGMTSFDELSVASIETRIDLKSVYPISQQRDRITASNGGGVTKGDGVFVVATTADADSEVTFRSVERGRYIAGIDAVAGLGVALPTQPTGNQEIEWGYTDFNNGFVAGYDATGVYMATYLGGTRSAKVYQSAWNVNKALTGAFVFDPTEMNIYRFAFRWYGRGPVTLELAGEEGFTTRKIRLNQVKAENGKLITEDPNQPLSMRIKNNGTASAITAELAGRNFGIRGHNIPELRESGALRKAVAVGTDDWVPLVSARHKNGTHETISTRLGGISILTNNDIEFRVIILGSLTGASFVNPELSDTGAESCMEYDISATALTGGISMTRPNIAIGGSGNRTDLLVADLPTLELPDNQQVVCLAARALTTSATVTATLAIREEW